MPNVGAGSTYKHRTFCYCGDQVGINTRYFQTVSVVGTPTSEQSFANQIDSILAPLYKALMYNSAQYVGSDIQNISGARPYPVQLGTQANIGAGTAGAGALPSQVSGIYTVRTANTGRSYRGRQYIPFPSSADSAVGPPPIPTNGYVARILALATALVGSQTYTFGGVTIVVMWGLLHRSPPAISGTFTPSTIAEANNNWATQRRRGDFGRTNLMPAP